MIATSSSAFVTAFLSSLLLLGCVSEEGYTPISEEDKSDHGVGAGSFNVLWSSSECPAGSAAEIISQSITNNERFIDIYDCVAGGGLIAALPLGDYDVWVEVTSADGSQLLAQSNAIEGASLTIDGQVAGIIIPDFPINDGFFGLSWSLVDTGGTALSCGDVESGGVDVMATLAGTAEATVDIFACTDFSAVTGAIPVGTHTVVVNILNGEDEALGSSEPREETISFGNELVDLGNFDFLF